MLKSGREPILIAAITGAFGAMAIVLTTKNEIFGISIFVLCLAFVYILISKSTKNVKNISHDPSAHPVFYTIEHCISTNLTQIPLTGKKKELVMLYIKTKMEVIKDILDNTIKEKDIHMLPITLLHANDKVRSKIASEVPEIFFERISEWDLKNNAWTLEPLRQIIESEYYRDSSIRYVACFDCVQVMIRSTIVAVENTIKSLNGELDSYLSGGKDV